MLKAKGTVYLADVGPMFLGLRDGVVIAKLPGMEQTDVGFVRVNVGHSGWVSAHLTVRKPDRNADKPKSYMSNVTLSNTTYTTEDVQQWKAHSDVSHITSLTELREPTAFYMPMYNLCEAWKWQFTGFDGCLLGIVKNDHISAFGRLLFVDIISPRTAKPVVVLQFTPKTLPTLTRRSSKPVHRRMRWRRCERPGTHMFRRTTCCSKHRI